MLRNTLKHLVRQNSGGQAFLVSQHGQSLLRGAWPILAQSPMSAAMVDIELAMSGWVVLAAHAAPIGAVAIDSAIRNARMVRIKIKPKTSCIS